MNDPKLLRVPTVAVDDYLVLQEVGLVPIRNYFKKQRQQTMMTTTTTMTKCSSNHHIRRLSKNVNKYCFNGRVVIC